MSDEGQVVAEVSAGATCGRCDSALDGLERVYVGPASYYDDSGTFCSEKCRLREEMEGRAGALRHLFTKLFSKDAPGKDRRKVRAEIAENLERLRLHAWRPAGEDGAQMDIGFKRAMTTVHDTELREAFEGMPGHDQARITNDQLHRAVEMFWKHGFMYGEAAEMERDEGSDG